MLSPHRLICYSVFCRWPVRRSAPGQGGRLDVSPGAYAYLTCTFFRVLGQL